MPWRPERQDQDRAELLWQQLKTFRNRIVESDTEGVFDPAEFDELVGAVRQPPPDWSEADWKMILDTADGLVASLSTPARIDLQIGGTTSSIEYVPLSGETQLTGLPDDGTLDAYRAPPLSVEAPTGRAAPTDALVAAIPSLAETLVTPDPRVPVVANWSWPCAEGLSLGLYQSHWLDEWTEAATATLESAWTKPEWDAVVQEEIERWSWRWPPKADAALLLGFPQLEEQLGDAHDADPRFRRKREAHRERWVCTAMQVGLHEIYRRRTSWPDPKPMACAVCGRMFPPEGLTEWMHRYYGLPRYCQPCCVRGINGRSEPANAEYVTATLAGLTEALGFVPSSDLRRLDVGGINDERRRDLVMAGLICLPETERCGEALGVEAGRGQWLRILQAAGVVRDAWRPSRGTLCTVADGHPCRSLGERAIDDWLSSHGIEHECEPPWPQHPELNRSTLKRADWLLPNGTFIEYAGMLDNAEYRDKLAQKVRLAQGEGVRLLVLTPDDLVNLDTALGLHMDLP